MNTFSGRTTGNIYVARLAKGDDLLAQLNAICERSGFRQGAIELIGAVEKAALGFYDQVAHRYATIRWETPMEIASGMGSLSIKDGKPFVHVHLTLAGEDGSCVGGHLCEGVIVFAAEVILREIETDRPLERTPDADTGLLLWR